MALPIASALATLETHPKRSILFVALFGEEEGLLGSKAYVTQHFADRDTMQPKPEFFNLVAAAAAIIFTVPKDDTATGTARCIKRMGLLRGDKVSMRFRRLSMECTRTKTDAMLVKTSKR